MKFIRWLSVLLLLCFTACERTIEFTPNDAEPKLVVEGTIETGKNPVVYLSRSMNYFSTISADELAGSFVRNAEIDVSDGSTTVRLKEYSLPVADNYFVYYYTVDTALQSDFKGEEGKTYSLSIKSDGKEYTSTTTIPHLTKIIDSLYYEENVDELDSSKVVLFGRFNDPAGFGNYTRYFTQTNEGLFYPGLNSVFDDQVIDGKSYEVQIEQGVDRNGTIDFEEYSYFHRGDTITIKYCNIDKGVFDFWRTMEYGYSSIGNPFSSPTRVMGNVSNGALGYFGGYAVQYLGIVIPE